VGERQDKENRKEVWRRGGEEGEGEGEGVQGEGEEEK